jgi:hypothetical protein
MKPQVIKYHKHLLDSALWLVCIASVAALFLAHEDPFARDALCSHTKICPVIENAKAWNKVFYDLAVGALVSVLFYFLLVRLPEYQKRQRIKKSLATQYNNFREDCIVNMLMVADGTFEWGFHRELVDQAKFKEYFKQPVGQGQDRWDAFLNKLDDYNLHELLMNLEIFRNEISFALNNVDIDDEKSFVFLKRLSNALFSMRDATLGYEEIKPLSRLLWTVFSGWDVVSGYSERDRISDAIAAI